MIKMAISSVIVGLDSKKSKSKSKLGIHQDSGY